MGGAMGGAMYGGGVVVGIRPAENNKNLFK